MRGRPAITISAEAKKRSVASIKRYCAENLDQDIGDLQAELLLDYFLNEIGPTAIIRRLPRLVCSSRNGQRISTAPAITLSSPTGRSGSEPPDRPRAGLSWPIRCSIRNTDAGACVGHLPARLTSVDFSGEEDRWPVHGAPWPAATSTQLSAREIDPARPT